MSMKIIFVFRFEPHPLVFPSRNSQTKGKWSLPCKPRVYKCRLFVSLKQRTVTKWFFQAPGTTCWHLESARSRVSNHKKSQKRRVKRKRTHKNHQQKRVVPYCAIFLGKTFTMWTTLLPSDGSECPTASRLARQSVAPKSNNATSRPAKSIKSQVIPI